MPIARFVTDSSLDFVARRLRFLGYDVAGFGSARLEELFEAAARDGRVLLTLSARHPRRFGSVAVLRVPRGEPAIAVREVAARFEPADPPFSRCPECNSPLQIRHPIEARGEVPGRVLRSYTEFRYCPLDGKWYWNGTHVERIRRWLESALGRPLAAPGTARKPGEAGPGAAIEP